MPSEKENLLKFHDGQCRLRFSFMLNKDFVSRLKQLDDQFREKMNQMKTIFKILESLYSEKINAYVLFGWCVHSTFVYGDVFDLLKTYCGKERVGKLVEHIEDELKWLNEKFSQQLMTELTDALKASINLQENVTYVLKSLMTLRIEIFFSIHYLMSIDIYNFLVIFIDNIVIKIDGMVYTKNNITEYL